MKKKAHMIIAKSLLTLIFFLYTNSFCYANLPLVYGHRGARAHLPENTLTGYAFTMKTGVDYIDMDVAFTKDKIAVVTHDLVLSPKIVSDLTGFFIPESAIKNEVFFVKNMTYNELKKYNVGRINLNHDYAKLFPFQKQLYFERIPKLEEAIDLAKNFTEKEIKFQIEVKSNPEKPEESFAPKESAQLLNNILVKKNIIHKTEIQSFDWSVLYELQKINPQIKTAYLTSRHTYDELTHTDEKIRTLWTGGKDIKHFGNCIPCMISKNGGHLWDPEDAELTKENLDLAHKLNLKVVVWNWPEKSGSFFNEAMIQKMVNWGVDGIISDDPEKLQKFIEKAKRQKTNLTPH